LKKTNYVLVNGKDLKLLIHLSKGILVFKENSLYFIGFDDPIKLLLSNLPQKAKEKYVFISEDFDKIKQLNDNDNYLLVFKENLLEIWNKNRTSVNTVLTGITV